MNLRHTLGDVGLAVLLALPTAALASPNAIFWQSRANVEQQQQQPYAKAAPERPVLPSRFDIPG
jgi:hypothetical protein